MSNAAAAFAIIQRQHARLKAASPTTMPPLRTKAAAGAAKPAKAQSPLIVTLLPAPHREAEQR